MNSICLSLIEKTNEHFSGLDAVDSWLHSDSLKGIFHQIPLHFFSPHTIDLYFYGDSMFNHKQLFGFAAIILSSSVFVRSFAYANGPNTSLGANPIFSFASTSCSSGQSVVSVPTGQVLVITDIYSGSSARESLQLKTASGTLLGDFQVIRNYSQSHYNFFIKGGEVSLRSGIVVPEGEDLVLYCGSQNRVTLSGYYAQP